MKKCLGTLFLGVLAISCGSNGPTQTITTPTAATTPAPTLAPTPVPTPSPSVIGFWKFTGRFNNEPLGVMNGYGIDITSHNLATGEIRGRSIFPISNLTGLLIGTVKSNGKVEWQTRYGTDTENGSMQLDATRRRMSGEVIFELNSINFNLRYFDMNMDLQR